ncbi:glycosyltransferase family 87 protein [Pleomorphomonas carboxyditropha]|uniref:DUF2029 domain-containing protein n=1 Tax=Pleomorphomonas carboxyditropha TaxID=2023338 RepID=A0A2G9WZ21_9HYPH|nr:glycosyltransferase family 87 protein [Pleomorphomonas carboxyditropha]PIO99913.1 hypothetical protein CJ014_08400 [Pleomorphomonas carboxyditropha]
MPPSPFPASVNLVTPRFSLGILGFSIFYVAYDAIVGFPPRGQFYVIGRDFANMWMGARLALSGDITTLFDWPAYVALLRKTFWPEFAVHNWSYPPHVLLFVWPLGLLPYHAALILWDVLGLAAFFGATKLAFRSLPPARRTWLSLATVGAPVVALNIVLGQVGLYIGALLIAAWILRNDHPVVSGILIGLLTMKPHLGLLLPLVLLAEHRYKVILSAAITFIILVVTTSLAFGWSVFPDYLAYVGPAQLHVLMTYERLDWIMPTPMLMARTLGLPINYGWVFVGIAAPSALAAFLYVLWRRAEDTVKLAALVTATILILPYAFSYDTALLIMPLVLLMDRMDKPWQQAILLSVYMLPALGLAAAISGIPLATASLVAFVGLLIYDIRRASKQVYADAVGESCPPLA